MTKERKSRPYVFPSLGQYDKDQEAKTSEQHISELQVEVGDLKTLNQSLTNITNHLEKNLDETRALLDAYRLVMKDMNNPTNK